MLLLVLVAASPLGPRCPYARLWLNYGPQKAAELLGLDFGQLRRLGGHEKAPLGTCTYSSQWTPGPPMCVDFYEASDQDDACAGIMGAQDPQYTNGGASCDRSDAAGLCWNKAQTQATVMSSAGGSCSDQQTGCGFMGGTWEPLGCAEKDAPTDGMAAVGGTDACSIAPGPMGGAHMAPNSPGYSRACQGTPGEGSEWQWPLAWAADYSHATMKYMSDAPQYKSTGRAMYRSDKNWKRQDFKTQEGVLRAIGQAPGAGQSLGESLVESTVLHRGSLMVFIDWGENGTIANCQTMDMFVGNIRPDWFMDRMGDSTDVQYLGNQHIIYEGEPKLVKQWRKQDFASMYFVMSMQAIPGEDGIHWPLTRNDPGEGFGDDALTVYTNHRVLTDADDALFLIDEAHVAAGGACPAYEYPEGEGGFDGPPVGMDHVPSNLEKDAAAWRRIEWTGSPVWAGPPVVEAPKPGAYTVTDGVLACVAGAELRLELEAAEPMWVGVSDRGSEEKCMMHPLEGTYPGVFALPGEAWTVGSHEVGVALRGFQAQITPATVEPLDGPSAVAHADGWQHVHVPLPDGAHLNFAMGSGSSVGYHAKRACFAVADLPKCPEAAPAPAPSGGDACDCDAPAGEAATESAAAVLLVVAALA